MAAAAAGSTITPNPVSAGLPPLAAPFHSRPGIVRPEWIDHNGHLNLAYYIVLFDQATDALWREIGLGEGYRARTGCGTFAVETHTLYLAELLEGDATRAVSLIVCVDAKRIHVAHELIREHDDTVTARQELMYLTVDLATRRSVRWPADVLLGLQAARQSHAALPRPDWVGRKVAMPAPRPV